MDGVDFIFRTHTAELSWRTAALNCKVSVASSTARSAYQNVVSLLRPPRWRSRDSKNCLPTSIWWLDCVLLLFLKHLSSAGLVVVLYRRYVCCERANRCRHANIPPCPNYKMYKNIRTLSSRAAWETCEFIYWSFYIHFDENSVYK